MRLRWLLPVTGITVIISIIVPVYTVAHGNRQVVIQTGERYICCDCQKVYKDTVHSVSVKAKDVKSYHIVIDTQDPCPNCTVEVKTGEKIVCPDCGAIIQEPGTIKVAKSQKDKYRVTEISQRCPDCQEAINRPGAFKHLPILLGKSRSEISKLYGQPQDSQDKRGFPPLIIPPPRPISGPSGNQLDPRGELIDLVWIYRKSEGADYLAIHFGSSGNRVGTAECVVFHLPPEQRPCAKDLLPRSLRDRQPDSINYSGNVIGIHFLIERNSEFRKSQLVEIVTIADGPITTAEKVFNEKEGFYEEKSHDNEEVINNWSNQKVQYFRQRFGELGDFLWCSLS